MADTEKVTSSLPCIKCGKQLKDALSDPSHGNQPYPGLEFMSQGHYGSTVFDLDPGYLIVNICDECIVSSSEAGLVRFRKFGSNHEDKDDLWKKDLP